MSVITIISKRFSKSSFLASAVYCERTSVTEHGSFGGESVPCRFTLRSVSIDNIRKKLAVFAGSSIGEVFSLCESPPSPLECASVDIIFAKLLV